MLQLVFFCLCSVQLIEAAQQDPAVKYMQIMRGLFNPGACSVEDTAAFDEFLDYYGYERVEEEDVYYDDNEHLKIARKLFPDPYADQAQYRSSMNDDQSDDENDDDPQKNYQEWLQMQEKNEARKQRECLMIKQELGFKQDDELITTAWFKRQELAVKRLKPHQKKPFKDRRSKLALLKRMPEENV